MPWGLRILTLLSLASALAFLAAAITPGGQRQINDADVTYGEWWMRGGGPVCLIIGIWTGFSAYGFLRATRWSRPCFLVGLVSAFAVGLFHSANVSDCLFVLVTQGIFTAYFFRRRAVLAYYGTFSPQSSDVSHFPD